MSLPDEHVKVFLDAAPGIDFVDKSESAIIVFRAPDNSLMNYQALGGSLLVHRPAEAPPSRRVKMHAA